MSNILSPQGFEPAEPLQDADVQEVYQPTSGGLRRNKQSPLSALKLFYQKLTSFTANNIMESDGTGNPRTTTISTADVSSTITRSQNNENTINDRTNQGVKTTDSPTFADANIGGHAIDAELDTLNDRVNQGVKDTDSPTFVGVDTDAITEKTLDAGVTVEGVLLKNGAIELVRTNTINENTPGAGVEIDGVAIRDGGINTDNAYVRKKIINIGDWNMPTTSALNIPHGLDVTKIRDVSVTIRPDPGTAPFRNYPLNYQDSVALAGYFNWYDTHITLIRMSGGVFDANVFDAISYNRGWIIITYIN